MGNEEPAVLENIHHRVQDSEVYVFIDIKKKVTFQTLFKHTVTKGTHETGMAPNVWIKGHAGRCGCPLGPTQHLCPFLPYSS